MFEESFGSCEYRRKYHCSAHHFTAPDGSALQDLQNFAVFPPFRKQEFNMGSASIFAHILAQLMHKHSTGKV